MAEYSEVGVNFKPYHIKMQKIVGNVKGISQSGGNFSSEKLFDIMIAVTEASSEINIEAIELSKKKISMMKLGKDDRWQDFDELKELYVSNLSDIIKNIDFFTKQLEEVIDYLPKEACHPALHVVYNNYKKSFEKFSETQKKLNY